MKIRRTNLLDLVQDAFVGSQKQLSPEERLVAARDHRQRQWRGHVHAYISVNAGLMVMNFVTAVLSGTFVPWSLFPLVGWGIGLGIHTLDHRAWLIDNRARLLTAETKLGIAPPARPLLAAGDDDKDPWPGILKSCEEAVQRAKALLAEVHPAAVDAQTDLQDGLDNVTQLGAGAGRIRDVLRSLAPDGPDGLQSQIDALDRQISGTEDHALREAHLANRALLLARRAKIQALQADRERMMAKAQGFLLAVENLHLDAARLTGGDSPEVLSAPIHRLTEEVQILRKVDRELKQLSQT